MPIDLIRPQPMRLSRIRGFQLQAASIALNGLRAKIVARPRPEGNPFKVSPPGDVLQRRQAICLFEMALNPDIELVDRPDLIKWRARLLPILPTLKGFNLACWCPLPGPGEPDCCHRSVLLRLCNPSFDYGPAPSLGALPDAIAVTWKDPKDPRTTPRHPPGGPLVSTPSAPPSRRVFVPERSHPRSPRPKGGQA